MPENCKVPLVFKRRKSIMQFRMQNRPKVSHKLVVKKTQRFYSCCEIFHLNWNPRKRSIKMNSINVNPEAEWYSSVKGCPVVIEEVRMLQRSIFMLSTNDVRYDIQYKTI